MHNAGNVLNGYVVIMRVPEVDSRVVYDTAQTNHKDIASTIGSCLEQVLLYSLISKHALFTRSRIQDFSGWRGSLVFLKFSECRVIWREI